jgi:hypothetical protein
LEAVKVNQMLLATPLELVEEAPQAVEEAVVAKVKAMLMKERVKEMEENKVLNHFPHP